MGPASPPPAVTWQLAGSGTKARSAKSKCPHFQGNRSFFLLVGLGVVAAVMVIALVGRWLG